MGPATALLTPPGRHQHAARPRRLLLFTHQDAAGNTGPATTTIYLGTDLDDAEVWARAVKLRARQVLVLPDQDSQLVALLPAHLGATA